jgi:hypothetical protein
MNTNQPNDNDDDVISADVTESIIAAIHAEAEADDFDEPLEMIAPEERAEGQPVTNGGASDEQEQ